MMAPIPDVFEDLSSTDLHRLGCISNEWLIHFRTFWTGTYFGAAFQTTVQESETGRADLFFIPFFMRGSSHNDHLLAVCILRCVQIQKYAARSHCLADRTPSAWHRSRNPRLRLCLVLGGGAPVDDLIAEHLEQMKRKDEGWGAHTWHKRVGMCARRRWFTVSQGFQGSGPEGW